MTELQELLDLCFITYVATSIVCLYGFLLFFKWLKSVEHKEVYVYVMMLIGSIFLYSVCNGFARYVFLVEYGATDFYESILTSWFWQVRAIPSFIFVTAIVWRMNRRAKATLQREKEKGMHRRATDK